MYLHRISGENFHVFGSKESGTDLQLEFASGLNVLVGENDAGKTSVIDAIRHALLTTSYEFLRIQEHDFHIEGDTRAKKLWLEAEFRGQAADVVVQLDRRCGAVGSCATFNDIRIKRSLGQKMRTLNSLRFPFEAFDEFVADDFSLGLRVGHAGEGF